MRPVVAVSALIALATAACDTSSSIEAALAQCTIDSYGDKGARFLKENASQRDRDAAYRNWMLLCMEARGFTLDARQCPSADAVSARSSSSRCYRKN